jgi:hypothetical protein
VLKDYIEKKRNNFEKLTSEIQKFEKKMEYSMLTKRELPKTMDSIDHGLDREHQFSEVSDEEMKFSQLASKNYLKRVKKKMCRVSINSNNICRNLIVPQKEVKLKKKPTYSIKMKKNKTSDLMEKVVMTLKGSQPMKKWMEKWNKIEKQIFWLIMSKIWVFSSSWESELKSSSNFPRSKGSISLTQKCQFTFYEKKIIKEILNQIFKDYQRNRMKMTMNDKEHHNFNFLFTEIKCGIKLRNKAFSIFNEYFYFAENETTQEVIICHKSITMKEISIIIQFLSFHPNIMFYFRKMTQEYVRGQNYSKSQEKVMLQRISTAINKFKGLIETGKFPLKGIRLNLDQITIMKKIQIFKPLQFWNLCFKRVLLKLTNSSN